MFMALLAVFQILLTRYTGQRDILVGAPIAGRTHSRRGRPYWLFCQYIGPADGQIKRPDLRFTRFCNRCERRVLEAYRHQDLPFEKLVEVLKPVRDPSRYPVVQAIFQLRQLSDLRLTFPEIDWPIRFL